MLQTAARLLPELSLFLMIAVATHLVTSFAQTLMHYKLGHHPMGGKFFRNRQGIPRGGISASAVCMVQTETGTALRSSPAREQQFRGDPFLLGQDSRYL